MKYFLWIVTVLVVFIGVLYLLLFSNIGNKILKPYLEKEVQKHIQNELHISAFTLKPNFIDLELNFDNGSKIIVNGDLDLFALGFDVKYILALKDIKTQYGDIAGIAALKGNIKGNKDNFIVKGDGEVFDAKTNISLGVQNKKITFVKVHATSLHVEKVLALLKQPIYSKGFVDVDANIRPVENNKLKGQGNVNIHFGQLNAKVIEKKFKITIPSNVTYRGTIDFNLDKDKVLAQSNITSNLFRLSTTKTIFLLDSQKLFSDFALFIPNFGAFKELVGIDLYGNMKVTGDITKDGDELNINAKSNALGGSIVANMHNDTASLKVSNIYVSELLKMLKQNPYSSGVLNSSVEVSSLKNLDFQSLTQISEATLEGKTLNQLLNKKHIPAIGYNLRLKASGHNNILEAGATLKSQIGNLDITDANYDLDKKLLYGKYTLHVDSLSSLAFLIGKKLYAKLDTSGEFKYDKEKFSLNGISDFLDSKTQYSLKDNIFALESNELAVEKITQMLHYPTIFQSFSALLLNYDLANSTGKFSLQTLNGKLVQSELTTLISALAKFDMTQEVYTKGELKGIINKQNIDYSALLTGLNSNFSLKEGKVNTKTEGIYGKFNVKIKNKDIGGRIQGSLKKPKITIDSSAYLKEKLDKEIDKHVPKKWKEPVKNILKLF